MKDNNENNVGRSDPQPPNLGGSRGSRGSRSDPQPPNLGGLVKDTAIYGFPSIVGRFLNYLLVPLYTAKMTAESGGYGVITHVYACTALLLVLLTCGMETTFFRFANKEGENPNRVYSTALIGVGSLSLVFVAVVLLLLTPLSNLSGYGENPQFVWVMTLTVAIDAFRAVPFSYLRYKKMPMKFASLQILNILVSIGLNCVYFLLLGGKDPGVVFYINLFCSTLVTLCLWQEIGQIRYGYDPALMRRMLKYSWPIVILGIAGVLNQVADKMMFPYIYDGDDAQKQLGIYGACAKVAMIMAMITQAFRYAYEPFVFGKTKDKDNDETQAKAMKYFLIFTLLAFVCVVGWMPLLKGIIAADYREGLDVVPVVMAAEIMMGVYFNLSFWYKLDDKTTWGAVFSGVGCAVLITLNIVFVPRYSYVACAWAGVAGYGTAMTLSYIVGQKYHPISYPLKDIAVYLLMTVVLTALILFFKQHIDNDLVALVLNTLCIVLFLAYILRRDLPPSSLPFIGKFFK